MPKPKYFVVYVPRAPVPKPFCLILSCCLSYPIHDGNRQSFQSLEAWEVGQILGGN